MDGDVEDCNIGPLKRATIAPVIDTTVTYEFGWTACASQTLIFHHFPIIHRKEGNTMINKF